MTSKKKVNVFYIFGYGGSPQSNTVENLKKLLGNKYKVISDFYAQYNPEEALVDLNNYIEKYNIDIIVASSLGGYLALQLENIPRIIINPCLHPEVELEKLTQEVQATDDEGKPKFDENNNPIMETIQAVPDHIINFYKEYIKNHDVWEKYNADENVIGIFGNDDELLGTKYIDEFKEHYNVKMSNQGHHNTYDSLKDFVVDEIKSIK